MYMAVKDSLDGISWIEWDEGLRLRKPEVMLHDCQALFSLFQTAYSLVPFPIPHSARYHHHNRAVIAEDLGFLTPSVLKLVKKTGYPGMKVLQFAFDSRVSATHPSAARIKLSQTAAFRFTPKYFFAP